MRRVNQGEIDHVRNGVYSLPGNKPITFEQEIKKVLILRLMESFDRLRVRCGRSSVDKSLGGSIVRELDHIHHLRERKP